MRVKAIICDLDGTLVDTHQDYSIDIYSKGMKQLDKTFRKEHVNILCYDHKRNDFLKEYYCIDPEQFWQIINDIDDPNVRKNFIYAYKDTIVLPELCEEGYVLAIVTGAPKHVAKIEVELLGEKLFKYVVSANPTHGLPRKPDPTGLEQCIKKLGIKPYEAIYLGNGHEDYECAQNANVPFILIDRQEFDTSIIPAQNRITTLDELRKFV